MAKTYTLSFKNSWTHGQMIISHTLTSNNRKAEITVKMVLWRDVAGGYDTSYNYNASKNFYIKIGDSVKYYTNQKISTTKETTTRTRTVTLGKDGTLSIGIKVGGSLKGTTFQITGNNSKTYKITGGAREKYTIKYSANGGENPPAAQIKSYGLALTIPSKIPTRDATTSTAYIFSHWDTAKDGTGANYEPGDKYTKEGSRTLYARWKAVNRYKITYNANGGSGAPGVQYKNAGEAIQISSTKPTRTNYYFKGWGTSASATTVAYTAKERYTADQSITLYAIWGTTLTYDIVYYANTTDTTVANMPKSQVKTHGTNITLHSNVPTRGQYVFSHWDKAKDGSGTNYQPGATYSTNADLNLYAIWTRNKWDVTYNANEGEGAPDPQEKVKDVTLTLQSTKPTRENYDFSKWNTKADGTGTNYNAGGTYTSNATLKLYAQWTPYSHTVSFNKNGGTGNTPDSFVKTTDNIVYIEAASETDDTIDLIPTKTGYVFVGWNTAADGSGTMYQPGDEYTPIQKTNVTLYAIWKDPNIYFYKNGNCTALSFIEGATTLSFTDTGTINMAEFIEGSATKISASNFTVKGELIEK